MDKSSVVRYHMGDEFNKLPKIVDFLVGIWEHERHILESWEQYFKGLKVPYAVTQRIYTSVDKRTYKKDPEKPRERSYLCWQLWKEDLVEESADKKYYKKNTEGISVKKKAYWKRNNP
jgi:hypothetical protein